MVLEVYIQAIHVAPPFQDPPKLVYWMTEYSRNVDSCLQTSFKHHKRLPDHMYTFKEPLKFVLELLESSR